MAINFNWGSDMDLVALLRKGLLGIGILAIPVLLTGCAMMTMPRYRERLRAEYFKGLASGVRQCEDAEKRKTALYHWHR